jgi:cbb3-type cytochrome oxidase maturation protein
MPMSALYVLLIFSLLVAAGFLVAYLVSVRKGQFDDDNDAGGSASTRNQTH